MTLSTKRACQLTTSGKNLSIKRTLITMKLFSSLLLFICMLCNAVAQKLETSPPRPTTPTTLMSRLRILQANAANPKVKDPSVTYSGFLVDLRTSPRLSKTLSLRNKVDPATDSENLITDVHEPTKPKGIKLFSLSF